MKAITYQRLGTKKRLLAHILIVHWLIGGHLWKVQFVVSELMGAHFLWVPNWLEALFHFVRPVVFEILSELAVFLCFGRYVGPYLVRFETLVHQHVMVNVLVDLRLARYLGFLDSILEALLIHRIVARNVFY